MACFTAERGAAAQQALLRRRSSGHSRWRYIRHPWQQAVAVREPAEPLTCQGACAHRAAETVGHIVRADACKQRANVQAGRQPCRTWSCHKLCVKNYLRRNHLAHRTPPQRPAPARTRKSATGWMEGAGGSSGRLARRLQAGCRCTASSWSTCLLHLMTSKCPGLLQRANERQRRGTARQDPAAAARQRPLEARKAPWSSSCVSAALTQVIAACGGAGGAEAG